MARRKLSGVCCAADESVLVLVRELFERLVLGLGKEECRENTRKHEEGEDLETENNQNRT